MIGLVVARTGGGKLKRKLKWIGIILLLFLIIVFFFDYQVKKETLALEIQNVDKSTISDGKYQGVYDSYRFSNQVEVTVINHRITEINPIQIQKGRQSLVDTLIEKVIKEQRVDIDVISGATASSKAF